LCEAILKIKFSYVKRYNKKKLNYFRGVLYNKSCNPLIIYGIWRTWQTIDINFQRKTSRGISQITVTEERGIGHESLGD